MGFVAASVLRTQSDGDAFAFVQASWASEL